MCGEMTVHQKADYSKSCQCLVAKPMAWKKMQEYTDLFNAGKSIAILRIEYRYACNMHCQHCSITKRYDPARASLTPNDVRRICNEADEMKLARIVVTGGEPLAFLDLWDLLRAIGPRRFYVNVDTNGYLLGPFMARRLKIAGVDRIQLSIDSLDPNEHDSFRGLRGSWIRANEAIKASQDAGLDVFIQTVVTRDRLHSEEFKRFLDHYNGLGLGVFVSFAKPVGAWTGRKEVMVGAEDFEYMRKLERNYDVFTHLTPGHGRDMGCIAVRGMITVGQHGDVHPCLYDDRAIGNVFQESLPAIIERGLKTPPWDKRIDTCYIADRGWSE
jgi:MoaA/NifB/PqqE/SkfB family radical SAM enzyme